MGGAHCHQGDRSSMYIDCYACPTQGRLHIEKERLDTNNRVEKGVIRTKHVATTTERGCKPCSPMTINVALSMRHGQPFISNVEGRDTSTQCRMARILVNCKVSIPTIWILPLTKRRVLRFKFGVTT
eukprot:scaffold44_cov339-Pavlova_lutheri.AAC.32